MTELRIPFVLWLANDVAPDLSSMAEPIRIPIAFQLDYSSSEQSQQANLIRIEEDANF